MLNQTLFPIREFNYDLLRFFPVFTNFLLNVLSWLFLVSLFPFALIIGRLWFQRLAIPFGVIEMVMRLYEIVDGEVILSIEQPCAATNKSA